MPEEELKRKEHLCRELIELTQRLDPALVRLQIYAGVSMFELHLPLLQYGQVRIGLVPRRRIDRLTVSLQVNEDRTVG